MQSKSLLYGIGGFILGGLIVSIAATTFDKPKETSTTSSDTPSTSMSMSSADALANKTGDDFDKAFISGMIAHHEGAVEMAKLSAKQANHDEIKTLSNDIIAAQEKEIAQMKDWQMQWGYMTSSSSMEGMDHSQMNR